jgi:hypothetical protein
MPDQPQPQSDDDLEAPASLVTAMRGLQKERVFVPPTVDEALLRAARQQLSARRRRGGPRWSVFPWAAAAVIVLGAGLVTVALRRTPAQSSAREDINRDGRVDILDAFALVRKIESKDARDRRWDINGDGRIDRADVEAIAARAVSLAGAKSEPKRSAGFPSGGGPARMWGYHRLRICAGAGEGRL